MMQRQSVPTGTVN